jgi:hypothetical protein
MFIWFPGRLSQILILFQIEYNVQMTCPSCVAAITKSLEGQDGKYFLDVAQAIRKIDIIITAKKWTFHHS